MLLIPPQKGSSTHLALVGDKQGKLYLVDANHLGGWSPTGNRVFQTLPISSNEVYATAAYDNGSVYIAANGGKLKQFKLQGNKLVLVAQSKEVFGYPGATPSVSANGASGGIVWAIERRVAVGDDGTPQGAAILHAYDANNISHELYSSSTTASGRDYAGTGIKFVVPTVADGRVFVGTGSSLSVYGLLA